MIMKRMVELNTEIELLKGELRLAKQYKPQDVQRLEDKIKELTNKFIK